MNLAAIEVHRRPTEVGSFLDFKLKDHSLLPEGQRNRAPSEETSKPAESLCAQRAKPRIGDEEMRVVDRPCGSGGRSTVVRSRVVGLPHHAVACDPARQGEVVAERRGINAVVENLLEAVHGQVAVGLYACR